jgi:carboxymethylenebutenolidase
MEEVARRFARSGFVALAPDLYHGKKAEEPDEAKKLAAALNRDRAIQEIIAAGQYLKSMDQVAPKWLGLVGWGLGGELSLSTTVFSADFAAVVAFYGRPPGPFDIPRIQAPILGIYAEVDVGIAAEDVREFERQLEQYRLPHDITIYPDTQHAFFNDAQPATYHDAAMHESWDRTLTWLRQHLG